MTNTSTPDASADLDLDRLVAGFVHALRRGGMNVTISQSTLFRAALDVVGLGNGIDVYWAGRATLVLKQEHVPMYDAMFLAFFHHNTSGFSMRFDDVERGTKERRLADRDVHAAPTQGVHEAGDEPVEIEIGRSVGGRRVGHAPATAARRCFRPSRRTLS